MKYLILIALLFQLSEIAAQKEINLTADCERNLKYINGVNNSYYSGQIEGVISEDETYIEKHWYSEKLLKEIIPLKLTNVRFPGGTLANFYHFYGAGGNGSDLTDLCKPGLWGMPEGAMIPRLRGDVNYRKNFIEDHIDFITALQKENNSNISTNYVLNILTHYINGDLKVINETIDSLIDEYFNKNAQTSQLPILKVDIQYHQLISDLIQEILSSDLVTTMKNEITSQSGFQYRLKENLDAIQHLKDANLTIFGAELGNEIYAYTMLYDDDLSEFNYDCTTIDTAIHTVKFHQNLPVGNTIEALIKYLILGQIYQEALDNKFETMKLGLVMAPRHENLKLVAGTLDQFTSTTNWTKNNRIHDIWNKTIATNNSHDAYIQHHYMPSFLNCEAAQNYNLDSISIFLTSYFRNFIKLLDEKVIYKDVQGKKNKELWITEWNVKKFVGSNTFYQAAYVADNLINYMSKCNESNLPPVTLLTYHRLSSPTYHAFSLLRANYNWETSFMQVDKHLTYYPFKIIGDLNDENLQLLSGNKTLDLFDNVEDDRLFKTFVFFNENTRKVELFYINYSDKFHILKLDNVEFNLQSTAFTSTITNHEYLQADKWYASNFVVSCETIKTNNGGFENFDYQNININESKSLTISPFMLGRISLNLETNVSIKNNIKQNQLNIYPNPVNTILNINIDLDRISKYQISDALGKVVKTGYLEDGLNTIAIYFPSGTYNMTVEIDNNLASQKFIIER